MKTLRIFSLATLFMAVAAVASAQTKTETFKVSGNCGMCKSNIEKAAKDAGANDTMLQYIELLQKNSTNIIA